MLWIDPQNRPGAYLSVHVTSFSSLRAQLRWRRQAPRTLAGVGGLRFAKAMTALSGGTTHGFGSDHPDLRRQMTIAVWEDTAAYERFTASAIGGALLREPGYSVLTRALSARGSFHGRRPIDAADSGPHDSALAVITLGRTSPRRLLRFLVHGARLTDAILGAEGLVTAASAGLPLTGNATFSVWEDSASMQRFAYGNRDGHRATAHAMPPILSEQLNARLLVLRIDGRWDQRTAHNAGGLTRVADDLASAAAAPE
jgi:hypothetical protein